MKKNGASWSLRAKIIMLCAVLILFSCILSSYLLNSTVDQIQDIYDSSARELLHVEANYLSNELSTLHMHITRMCADENFTATLTAQAKKTAHTPDILSLSTISSLMDNAINGLKLVRSCFVHTSHGDYFQMIHGYRSSFDFSQTNISRILQSSDASGVIYCVAQTDEFYKTGATVVPFVYHFYSSVIQDEITVVVLLDEWSLYASLNQRTGTPGQTILVNSDNQQVLQARGTAAEELFSSGIVSMEHLHEGTDRFVYHGTEYLINTLSISSLVPWSIVNIAAVDTLMPRLQPTVVVIVLLIIAMVVFSIIFSIVVSRSITRPIVQLSEKMGSVQELPTHVELNEHYSGEAGVLAGKFNQMIHTINVTVDQLKEEKEKARVEQLLKRRAELKALQAQINPHFLYNTLDSISWMAFEAGANEISDMTVALADLFRTGLNRGNELATVEEEAIHVESYLRIQKMRYTERFDYQIDIPERLHTLYTVKLVLQPLVENAIYHGIRESGRRGLIRVQASQEDETLVLSVEDNGIGFPEDSMEQINRYLADGMIVDKEGYGIFNVNERVRLYFGEHYGLRYSREQGMTRAAVRMPTVSETEVDQYVEYFDHR